MSVSLCLASAVKSCHSVSAIAAFIAKGKAVCHSSVTELENGATASGSGRWKEQQESPGNLETHDQHSSHPKQGNVTLRIEKESKHLIPYCAKVMRAKLANFACSLFSHHKF